VHIRPDDLGPQHRLVQPELAVELLDRRRLGGELDDGIDAFGALVDLVREAPPAPDVELLDAAATLPDRLRYWSSDGATVRSSRSGSRMTMSSYRRKAFRPPMGSAVTVVP
jgi:hypothetical protein